MNDKETIVLHSRYKDVHSELVKVGDNLYKLVTSSFFIRELYDYDEGEIAAIDLEGGPMLGTGDELKKGVTINTIFKETKEKAYYIRTITHTTHNNEDITKEIQSGLSVTQDGSSTHN